MKALFVELGGELREFLCSWAAERGHEVTCRDTYPGQRAPAESHGYDIVVACGTTGGRPATELLALLRASTETARAYVVAVVGDGAERQSVIEAAADEVLTWPASAAEVGRRMAVAEQRARHRRDEAAAPEAAESSSVTAVLGDTEGQLRKLIEALPDGLILYSAKDGGRMIYVNPAGARILGASDPSELEGQPGFRFVHEDDLAAVDDYMRRTLKGEDFIDPIAVRAVALDGRSLDVEMVSTATDFGGERVVQVIFRDITGQKRARELLGQSEERYRRLVEASPNGIAVHQDGLLVYANPAALRLLGATDFSQVAGRRMGEMLAPGEGERVLSPVRTPGEQAALTETTIVRLDGTAVEVEIASIPTVHDGRPAMQTVVRDISDRKRAEQLLQASEERLRTIIDASPDPISILEPDGRVRFANSAHRRILGWNPDEMAGKSALEWVHPDDLGPVLEALASIERGGRDREMMVRLRHADGHWVPADVSGRLLTDRAGTPAGIVVVSRDVSDRIEAEEALRASNDFRDGVMESATNAIYALDLEGRFTLVNRRACEISGYSEDELIGDTFARLYSPEALARNAAAFQQAAVGGERVLGFETELIRKDGEVVTITFSLAPMVQDGKIVGIAGTAEDVTERRRAEAERLELERKLLEAQRLESLGVLAGGVAHDFNNLLLAIMGNASLAMMEATPQVASYLREIERASQRAAELARQMLDYSGKGRLAVEPVNLGPLVDELARMLRASLPTRATLELAIDHGLPEAVADPTQIRQIVMNLVINAAEAIGEAKGTIRISTGVMQADRAYLADVHGAPDLAEGEYVFVELTDTGAGMDEATRARIFDPFFTTKFTGRGLGLAAVLGIVRAHRGAIRVESEPGNGTTFRLLLPVADEETE